MSLPDGSVQAVSIRLCASKTGKVNHSVSEKETGRVGNLGMCGSGIWYTIV